MSAQLGSAGHGTLEIASGRLYWSENFTLTPRCRK